ncbi:SDR family NAD(P)-dependent oxidoreductase [Mycoplasmatota bacterium]|nr:SDR family NAD(P)-dependent oxidoreductase [Mycoplasmatota bacterium]
MRNLKNRTYLVTGAGSGMGRELVLQLLDMECYIAAVDINKEALDETFDLANVDKSRLSLHIADISSKDEIKRLKDEVIKHHKKLDGIFNNAGIIQPFVKFQDLNEKDIERVININTYGVLYMTKSFLPSILESDQGIIANTSSMGGFLPVPGQGVYGASKGAVKLFTEALYAELLDTNVNVHVIMPGAIKTNISKNSGVNISGGDSSSHKTLSAKDAAKTIIKGVKKEKLRILVGKDAKLMDKIYRFFPVFAIKMIYKQMKDLLN